MSDSFARLGLLGMAAGLLGRMAGCNGEDEKKTPKEPPGKDAGANLSDTASSDTAGDLPSLQYDSYVTSCENLLPEERGLKINEALFDPEGDDAGQEWVELFNKSNRPININGYTLSNNSAATLLTFPNVSVPACAYYVAHLPNESLNNEQDAVVLFNGEPSTNTIKDFAAYSALGMIEEGHAFAMAKAAGIWSEGDFVDVAGKTGDPTFIRTILPEGQSIGRDRDSTDTNTSADWAPLGGVHAFGQTAGAVNFFPITVAEPVAEIAAQDRTPWTFLMYLAADNDLEGWGLWDLNILERVGSTANVNIGVLVDLATKRLNRQTPPGTSAYIHIQRDRADPKNDRLISPPQILDEVNTGDPAVLANFLDWGVHTLPADHYYLVIWGHGNGWKGAAWDFSNSVAAQAGTNDRLTMDELRTALAGGPEIGVLTFYSCMLGGIEVAHQMQERARFMVASEEVLRTTGAGTLPWDQILREMDRVPGIEPEALARFTVRAGNTALAGFNERTLSALRLEGENLGTLVTRVSEFAERLREGLEDVRTQDDNDDNVQVLLRQMLEGSGRVESFTYLSRGTFSGPAPDYRDLFHLAERIQANNKIANRWKERAQGVLDARGGVVIEERHGAGHPKARGLSIYFPKAKTVEENASLLSVNDHSPPFDTPLSDVNTNRQLYAADNDATAPAGHPLPAADLRFATATQWDEFLHRYYNPVADASCHTADNALIGGQSTCQVTPDEPVTFKAVGSSDSDGRIFAVGTSEEERAAENFYWDFETTRNTDNDDYDKDNNGAEPDDDMDARGREVPFTCAEYGLASGGHRIRLMVWDDHHTVESELSGNHHDHYQTDDAWVDVICIQPM